MHTWGPHRQNEIGRRKVSWSRARKWLRLSGFNRMIAKLQMDLGRGFLRWYGLYPVMHSTLVMANRWHRWHQAPSHTQGRHYKWVTALFTADLAFGFRILLPPSWQPLLINRYWHSSHWVCHPFIGQKTCSTCCHLCVMWQPHRWSEHSSILV